MMAKNDAAGMQWGDLAEAIVLLTRLPAKTDAARGATAAWAWPLAGALIGLLSAIAAVFALLIGLPASIAAGIALACQIILTGALHEDGLADCADGFWGGHDPTTRLDIMQDSRIGAYGVLAISFALGFRWLLLASLFDADTVFAPLIATAALSRVPMVALMTWLPPAHAGGLSDSLGRPTRDTLILTTTTGLLIAVLVVGFAAIPAALIALILSWAAAKIALAKINGQTGDVLGASQQITEIGVLMGFVAIVA